VVGVIVGVAVGLGVGDVEVGVGVTEVCVGVGVNVGVGVVDGHSPTNTISKGALYPSTDKSLAQRYSVCNGLIVLTLTMSVHPVHL
jgi:hypothetical protein